MTAKISMCLEEQVSCRMQALLEAVRTAEALALEYYGRRSELVRVNKSPTDFVSAADEAVEECIRASILSKHPDDIVVGEELGGKCTQDYWIVDPIDGTSNFLSGLPFWAISVAYVVAGTPVLGAVALPVLRRQFAGGMGVPFYEVGRNGIDEKPQSVVFGVGNNEFWPINCRSRIEAELTKNGLVAATFGSCAASLALVASGELAGYAEGYVGFWDIAAGVALCESAGIDVGFIGAPGTNQSFVTAAPTKFQSRLFLITTEYRDH